MQYRNGETKLIEHSFEFTIHDLNLLEQLRLKRLRSFFAQSLLYCLIYLNHQKTVIIHCPDLMVMDYLMNDLEDLCNCAGLILGAKAIALYFVEEEIYFAKINGILKPP
jgi:hypothetical protein